MKNKLILIVALVISLLSMTYAYAQRTIAKEHMQLAIENQRRAEAMEKMAKEQMHLANEQRMIAEQNAKMAMEQNLLLQEHLKKQKK